ncbi:MAG: proteasome endopeptidase complex, archaeal, beta subunit [Candidatus Aenigmarchaeota archaeon ex4484_52]|nr:MAG: proteasome endopeptidase complex, archaeal, beta subunit [Candidatus Aenigmarchaeota archaeon ex4484_52]
MEEKIKKIQTGTTTLGLVCKDGIILAADNKATMGHLIVQKETKKIYPIIDQIAITIAGTVGDAQALIRLIRAEMHLHKFDQKHISVKATTTLLSNILRSSYKSFIPEMVQLILGGYDFRGPQLYSLDAVGGISEEKKYTFSGSGSVIAVGVLEADYKENISIEDAVELAKKALISAKERDVYSGGIGFDILKITKDKTDWIKI